MFPNSFISLTFLPSYFKVILNVTCPVGIISLFILGEVNTHIDDLEASSSSSTTVQIKDVGVQLDDDAYVVRIIIPIDNEETGKTVADGVNQRAKLCGKA